MLHHLDSLLENIEPDQYVVMGEHKLYLIYLNSSSVEAYRIEYHNNVEWYLEWYLTQPYEEVMYILKYPVDVCLI